MNNAKTKKVKPAAEHEELLIAAILDFYKKHRGYRMTQKEFVGLICAITQQAMSDIQWGVVSVSGQWLVTGGFWNNFIITN